MLTNVYINVVVCVICRSAAAGAGAGDEDAADPIEAVLPRREAKPPRQVYQGCGGQFLYSYLVCPLSRITVLRPEYEFFYVE